MIRLPSPPYGRALAAFAVLLGSLSAQQRLATAGRVLDGSGQPLAGATVTFVGSEPPIGDRFGAADHVVTTTDHKGRFRVELLVGSEYVCWAIGPPAESGVCRVSEVRDGVRAGAGLEFGAATPATACRLAVRGLEPWRTAGPLHVEASFTVAPLPRIRLTLVDGTASLPAAPAGAAWVLCVSDATGGLFYVARFEPRPEEVVFEMPPPCDLPVRVADANGAPVAGATLRVTVGDGVWLGSTTGVLPARPLIEWRDAGTTGADGTAVVRIASREDPFANGQGRAMLLASKPGHAPALSGWNGQTIVDGRQVAPLAKRELPFTLHPGRGFGGRLVGSDGRPLADVGVQLAARQSMSLLAGGRLHAATMFSTRTDRDGTFALELPAGLLAPALLVEIPTSDGSAEGAATTEPPAGPRTPTFVRTPALRLPDLEQPFDLDLRTMAMLTVRARATSGDPARDAHVVLLPLPIGEQQIDHATMAFRLDATGAAAVRVQPGAWFVFVTDRVGFAHRVLDVAAPTELALELAGLAAMHGHVLAGGEPAPAGARFVQNSSSLGPADGDAAMTALRALGRRINPWLAATTRVGTDGAFVLRFLDVPGSRWSGMVTAPGLRSAAFVFQASNEPQVIELGVK